MDLQSVYYDSFHTAIEKYGLEPQVVPISAGDVQGPEEMFFGWAIYLLS